MTVKAARAARVQALREAVARGTYHVDSEQVAEAIVRRALLHRRLHTTLNKRPPVAGEDHRP